MKQGEIWYAELSPTKGSEQAGRRPVVIVSGNLLNQHLPIVIVVPVTTKIKNYKGNPIIKPSLANGLTSESEMLIFHIRSVSKHRLKEKLGNVDDQHMKLAIKTFNDILKY
jgi:mRNA interferase MazF